MLKKFLGNFAILYTFSIIQLIFVITSILIAFTIGSNKLNSHVFDIPKMVFSRE